MDVSDLEVFGSLGQLFDYSSLDNGQPLAPSANLPPHHPVHIQDLPEPQMSPDFVPHPPTEQEIAPFPRLIPSLPVHIQGTSENQMLPASALPTDEPAHPPHQNVHPDHNQDILIETNMLQAAYSHPIPTNDEPAHPPQDQSASDQIMEGSNTHGILPAVITFSSTGSEPDHHQPPPQQGALGQDDSKTLMLVPNTTPPPPTEPQNNNVVIDIGSDSESDNSNEVRILGSFTPLDLPPATTTTTTTTTTIPPPTTITTTTTTTPITSRFGESPLLYPVPVSWIHPSDLRLLCDRGETTDDERTETDDDVLPSPPPPQPSPPPLQQSDLEEQLAIAMKDLEYWSKEVKRGIQGEPKRPEWLPEDWKMECVTRNKGLSAGNRDKYYIEPGVKRRKFRSKREVLQFIESGKQKKYKRKANSTAMVLSKVNRPFEGTSSSSWQNLMIVSHLEASTSWQNEETPNLDPDTVPEKQNEETPPNVDSDQDPPKRPRGSPSKEP